MEFEDIQNQYKEVLKHLSELTKKPIEEIEAELNNTKDLEELLTKAAEMFED